MTEIRAWIDALKSQYDRAKPEDCAMIAFNAIQLAESAEIALAAARGKEGLRIAEAVEKALDLDPNAGDVESGDPADFIIAMVRAALAAALRERDEALVRVDDFEDGWKFCPWCGERVIAGRGEPLVLKSGEGCLIAEIHGRAWHAGCAVERDELLEAKTQLAAALAAQEEAACAEKRLADLCDAHEEQFIAREAAEARLAAIELQIREWQPIETAPQDGRHILIWFVYDWYGEKEDAHAIVYWTAHNGGGWVGYYKGRPTHWMSLPEPPTAFRRQRTGDPAEKEKGQQYSCLTKRGVSRSALADEGEDEGEPVTLCIAAECEHEGDSAIVLCWDWRAQHGSSGDLVIGTDDVDKMREVGKASVLIAGSRTKAEELVVAAKSAIVHAADTINSENADVTVDDLLRSLRVVARDRKTEIVRHFVQMETGIPLDEFRKQPRYEETDTWLRVRHLTLDADIIISFVASRVEPITVSLDRFGEAAWRLNYWAIGEGSMVARAFLAVRPWELTGPLNECLYRVYEAKRAAHIANPQAVGRETGFQVLLPRGKKTVTQDCVEILQDIFDKKHRWPHDEKLKSLVEFKPEWLCDGTPPPW